AALRSLLETRAAADVTYPGLLGQLAEDQLVGTPEMLVARLQRAHLVATDPGSRRISERVHELLVGRADQLDAVDAAELRVLLAADRAAPNVPRTLGVTSLDDLLAHIA